MDSKKKQLFVAASNLSTQSLSRPMFLLLLGKKLSGKSSVGNSILGREAFHKNTTRSSRENGNIFGKQVTMVDTPGWLSDGATSESASSEICRGLTLCAPEPNAILLAVPITCTFDKKEWNPIEDQLRLLQTTIWDRTIILFTHGDRLGGVSIQEYIKQQGQTLRWLLERCGNRYQVMSNQPSASETQVTELFKKIQKMIETGKPSKDIQNKLYTKLRHDASRDGEMRWQERRGEFEMTVMYDAQDRRPRHASGRQESTAHPHVSKPPLAFILLGRSKSGKSSAGNIILKKNEFQEHQYKRTTRCSVGHGVVSERPVTVVDTPGWSAFGRTNQEEVKSEIRRSRSLCPEGSAVTFLLAIPADSFGERDRRAAEEFVGTLGEDVWRSSVVVFTYGDQLEEKSLQEHVTGQGEPLWALLRKCGNRHVVFDTETEDDNQVKLLLQTVDNM